MAKGLRGYRRLGFAVLILSFILVGLPAILVRGCDWKAQPSRKGKETLVKLQLAEGNVITLPLEEYLIGVVAAEMPASFHEEALKAQAVAARTYALRRLLLEKPDGDHPGAHLCADSTHCQAWISTAEMRKRWGIIHFRYYYNKVCAAVRETEGEVLVYEDELIDPVYHSSCGGRGTEDARDVWGEDVPYLKRVSCTFDPPQRQEPVTSRYRLADLVSRLGLSGEAVPAAAGTSSFIRVKERTAGGRVKTVLVGTRTYQGTELRKALGLHSTDFTVEVSGGEVTFRTRGYGHAVGMCQYGAEGLAQKGVPYDKILTYYYRGVSLKKWLPESGR